MGPPDGSRSELARGAETAPAPFADAGCGVVSGVLPLALVHGRMAELSRTRSDARTIYRPAAARTDLSGSIFGRRSFPPQSKADAVQEGLFQSELSVPGVPKEREVPGLR